MANDNKGLKNAKTSKKDEFYTQLSDIESELPKYAKSFYNKTIYCPCDDPRQSEFYTHLYTHFHDYHLKELITSVYTPEINPTPRPFIQTYNGQTITTKPLTTNGDFRNQELLPLFEKSDIIITNPPKPFSLFREFITLLFNQNKKFLIIGHQNAITYKDVYPKIQSNELWLSASFKRNIAFFKSPYQDHATDKDHRDGLIRVAGVMWFTNLDTPSRHTKFNFKSKYKGNEDN